MPKLSLCLFIAVKVIHANVNENLNLNLQPTNNISCSLPRPTFKCILLTLNSKEFGCLFNGLLGSMLPNYSFKFYNWVHQVASLELFIDPIG